MARRLISLLLIMVVTAGCGSRSVISNPKMVETLDEREHPEIAFWHTYSDEETRLLEEELIPAFEREHPDIRIKPLRLAISNELKNALIARASSNRGPDVVRMDVSWVPEFSQNGLLESLNRFPGFEEIRGTLHKGAMSVGFFQNQHYSLPLNINTKVAIFNRKLLEKAGYKEAPRTMEEVVKIARQHRFTIGIGGWDGWRTLPYLYSLGGVLTDEHFKKASGYLNGEGTIRAVEQLADLYKQKLTDLSMVTGGGDNWAGVQSGNVLVTAEGPWFYSILSEAELNRVLTRTLPVPLPYGNGPASIMSGENLVMMKGSKQAAEAWAFMRWMTGKQAQLIMSRTGLIPTNLEAAKTLNSNRNSFTIPHVNPNSFIYPYIEALDHAFLRPPVKNWSKIDGVYTFYLRKIFVGELSVKAGLDRAATEIDILLADS